MKSNEVQRQLDKAAAEFCTAKKYTEGSLLEHVVQAMAPIGGIGGFNVRANARMTIQNHSDRYTLRITFPEYGEGMSFLDRKCIEFVRIFKAYLISQGVSKTSMEYHLGKGCSSKHHDIFSRQ